MTYDELRWLANHTTAPLNLDNRFLARLLEFVPPGRQWEVDRLLETLDMDKLPKLGNLKAKGGRN